MSSSGLDMNINMDAVMNINVARIPLPENDPHVIIANQTAAPYTDSLIGQQYRDPNEWSSADEAPYGL